MQMTNHILYLIPLFLNKRVRQIDQFVHVVIVEIKIVIRATLLTEYFYFKSIKVDNYLLKQAERFLNYSQIHNNTSNFLN